jgi:hypothetical protein
MFPRPVRGFPHSFSLSEPIDPNMVNHKMTHYRGGQYGGRRPKKEDVISQRPALRGRFVGVRNGKAAGPILTAPGAK